MDWGLAVIFKILGGGVFGAVFGSFAATAALRMAESRDPLRGRSACDDCHKALTWAETVPIAGYVAMGGRCRSCSAPINRFHLIGEGLGALILGGSLGLYGWPQAPLIGALGLMLLLQSLIDLKTYRLPDIGNAIIAGLCAVLAWLNDTLIEGLIAAVVSWGILTGLRYVMTRRHGQDILGGGDIKLIAALAFVAGDNTPYLLAIAANLTLLWALITKPKPAGGRLPFGPALAVMGLILLFWRIGA